MSQFFWKTKLWVLLNRLPFISNSENREEKGEDTTQLRCLEEWLGEGRSQRLPDAAFPNPDLKQLANFGSIRLPTIPLDVLTCPDARKVFWWFWRCYPQWVENTSDANRQETQFVGQNSAWSQVALNSVLEAGRLGYFTCSEDYLSQENQIQQKPVHSSSSYLAQFSFTFVSELIQASCTLQNIQIQSWLSHLIAAKICWKIAWKYGPDIFIAPCLYAQPLVDYWLLQAYPDFSHWISPPTVSARNTARFPATLTLILPDNGSAEAMKGNPIWATMLHAEQILKQEWLGLAHQALNALHSQKTERRAAPQKWDSWLESWWQSCWVAVPIVDRPRFPSSVPSSHAGFAQQSLMHEVYQQLEIAKYSQVWKIPTAFNLRSTDSENNEDNSELRLDSEAVLRGLSQLPHFVQWSEKFDRASLTDNQINQSSEWHLLAAGRVRLKTNALGNTPDTELAAYAAYYRTFAELQRSIFDLVEQQYRGQFITARDDEILLSCSVPNWEELAWDVYQCFAAPGWAIDFHMDLVIAHRSLPLPLVLKYLREVQAISHLHQDLNPGGIQVHLLHQHGEVLTAFAEWQVFNQWRSLVRLAGLQPILFDRLSHCWKQHPIPSVAAIKVWVTTISDAVLKEHGLLDPSSLNAESTNAASTAQLIFCEKLSQFLDGVLRSSQDKFCEADRTQLDDHQVKAWLDLAAFTLRSGLLTPVEQAQDEKNISCQNLREGDDP